MMFEQLSPKLFHPDLNRSIRQSMPVSQSMEMHQIHPNWKLSNFLPMLPKSGTIMKRKLLEQIESHEQKIGFYLW